MKNDKKIMIYNGEEIEVLDLSTPTIENNQNKEENKKEKHKISDKMKKILVFGVPSIVGVFILTIVIVYFINKDPEITYKNKIENKQKIETSLDLEGIFISDNINEESEYKIENKALINNNKIYYSYSPSYCPSDKNLIPTCISIEEKIEECEKEIKTTCKRDENSPECEENYCEEKYKTENCAEENEIKYKEKSLCENYYTDIEDTESLYQRYILSSNLDGTKTEEITKHDLVSFVTFDYKTNDFALYYSEGDETTYKLNFKDNEITEIKNGAKILERPISNDNKSILIETNDENYKLNIYNNDFTKKPKTIKIYNDDLEKTNIRIDKYQPDTYYSMSNSKYDTSLENKNNGLYKNGKLIYEFKNTYKDFFIDGNSVVILTTNGYNVRILKIDKETYEEKGAKIILKRNKQINEISFIAYANDNLVYLNIDGEIYTYNENDNSLTETKIKFNELTSHGTYNNFIYFYGQINNDNLKTLNLYNTETKESYEIKNTVYFKINDDKLYTVENSDDKLELYSYNIN